MAINHFDLIVIGAGSENRRCKKSGFYKKSVLLIEERDLGGTCVNRGCVPKKVGFNLAQIMEFMEHSNFYGLEANGRLDYETFKKPETNILVGYIQFMVIIWPQATCN